MTAIIWPSGADSPSLIRILRNTPLANACISMVALSVSISANGSPMETRSPSFLSHRDSSPSSMVGESLGIITSVAICSSAKFQLLDIRDIAHGRYYLGDARNGQRLEILGVRHGNV